MVVLLKFVRNCKEFGSNRRGNREDFAQNRKNVGQKSQRFQSNSKKNVEIAMILV